jgi:hypothetical protein
LVYGLFRGSCAEQEDEQQDQQQFDTSSRPARLAREQLSILAAQLRLLRVRGVMRTLCSLGIFLIAFAFSVVLAFGNLGESTTVITLSLGLLFSWIPLLETFTIVDRNPSSPDRWR